MLLSVVLALIAPSARADIGLISDVSVFADHTAQMPVAAVSQQRFIPTGQTVTVGYTNAAQWFRVRIQPSPSGEPVVLLIRPPMLDNVQVYQPILPSPDDPSASLATEQYEAVERFWPSSLRGYIITPSEGGTEYFVRIGSSGSIAVNLTAVPRANAVQSSLLVEIMQILYLSLMLTLMLWSMRLYTLTRELLFGLFSAMQSVWLFHNILSFGYVEIIFPGLEFEINVLAFRAAVFLASILSIFYHRALLVRFEPIPLATRMFDFQLSLMLIAFVIFWTVDRKLGLQINAYCLFMTPAIFLINIATARKDVSPGLSTVRVIYTVLSVFLILWMSSLLGKNSSWLISLYGFMIHGLSTGLLMFFILHRHGRNLYAAAIDAETEIARIEHQRSIEQAKTQTLAQFINMLSHEARNALSVINMSVATPKITERQRARVHDAIRGLSGVIDRCIETVHLDTQDSPIARGRCDLCEILQRVCAERAQTGRIDLQEHGPVVIWGDPVLIGVVFSNLVDNALKYSPEGSTISIRVEIDADEFCTVFENEPGAAGRPDPDRAFEKYYRSENAKAQIGSGLGLYVVRGLVELHGGKVTCEPTSKLIRFKVCFPC